MNWTDKDWGNPNGNVQSAQGGWITLDPSTGTVYGNAASITGRTANSITIDPSVSAGAYLDNSPDNRVDYAWITSEIDLSQLDPGGISIGMDMKLDASPPSEGSCIGLMIHNGSSPLTSTAFCGSWVQRKTNGDGVFWAINNWGSLGGNFGAWASKSRVVSGLTLDNAKAKIISWFAKPVNQSGDAVDSISNSRIYQAFDTTGGIWISVICGTYQPRATPPAPQTYYPVLRYKVSS